MTDQRPSETCGVPVVWNGWCDFPYCGSSCWTRCNIDNGRWDGVPVHLWRQVWHVLRRMPKPERRKYILKPAPAAGQPLQLELV